MVLYYMIKFHPAKKVKRSALFTVCGLPVYALGNSGKSHTLSSVSKGGFPLLKATTLYGTGEKFNVKRLEMASLQTGKKCEWRDNGDVEVMGVSF